MKTSPLISKPKHLERRMSLTLRQRQLCLKTAKEAPHMAEKSTTVRILERNLKSQITLEKSIHRIWTAVGHRPQTGC
jgi:hypothetical protein